MRVVPIHPDDLTTFWPSIAPFALQMAERFPDDYPVQEIARQAVSRELMLWLIWDGDKAVAALGTKVRELPSGRRILDISWCAGSDHRQWTHLIHVLEQHGRKFGCSEVTIRGRAGWLPSLKGYRIEKEITLKKDLDDGEAKKRGNPVHNRPDLDRRALHASDSWH